MLPAQRTLGPAGHLKEALEKNFGSVDKFKEELDKLKIPAHIYVFSLTNDTYASDFENLEIKHKLCPIPESILEVYRKLFKEIINQWLWWYYEA